jgi:hypothetical protein
LNLVQVIEEPEFAENMVKGAFQRSSSSGSSSEEESRSLRGGKKTRRRQIQVAESRRPRIRGVVIHSLSEALRDGGAAKTRRSIGSRPTCNHG